MFMSRFYFETFDFWTAVIAGKARFQQPRLGSSIPKKERMIEDEEKYQQPNKVWLTVSRSSENIIRGVNTSDLV